jgi:hypothetical protein
MLFPSKLTVPYKFRVSTPVVIVVVADKFRSLTFQHYLDLSIQQEILGEKFRFSSEWFEFFDLILLSDLWSFDSGQMKDDVMKSREKDNSQCTSGQYFLNNT